MANRKTTTTKKVDKLKNEKVVPIKDEKLENENKILKLQLEQMQKMMEELNNKVKESEKIKEEKVIEEVIEDEIIDIPLNKVIKVMSLFAGGMTLKTADNGKTYRFNKLGDMQPILYNDLIQIMAHQQRFTNEGYFMILDKDVVRSHGLETLYTNILDVKQINKILDYDDEKIKQIIANTTSNIKSSIISVVVDKIKNENNIDKNKIHVLNEILDMDLFAYARGDVELLVNSKAK